MVHHSCHYYHIPPPSSSLSSSGDKAETGLAIGTKCNLVDLNKQHLLRVVNLTNEGATEIIVIIATISTTIITTTIITIITISSSAERTQPALVSDASCQAAR